MSKLFKVHKHWAASPDLEQTITLSPAFRNSFAKAYPIPEFREIVIKNPTLTMRNEIKKEVKIVISQTARNVNL